MLFYLYTVAINTGNRIRGSLGVMKVRQAGDLLQIATLNEA